MSHDVFRALMMDDTHGFYDDVLRVRGIIVLEVNDPDLKGDSFVLTRMV